MDRRKLLKGLLTLPLCNGLFRSAEAAAAGRVLVVVFMRGGWDGLNIVVPYGDDYYHKLRPTIAVRPPSVGGVAAALDLDGFFGFHPSLGSLYQLYQSGQVAVMPAVHYSGSSRSHFSGQDIVESASLSSQESGWLGRYLIQAHESPLDKAISLADQVPLSLRGPATPVAAYPDVATLQLASTVGDQALIGRAINEGYAWNLPSNNPNRIALQGIGVRLVDELSRLKAAAQISPSNGVLYPSTGFGRQLRQAAALIKADLGLEIVTLNLGGWDTHSNQGGGDETGKMSVMLRGFSDSVGAFFGDLGVDASRVVLLTATEFGRTAAENGSKGTDHGNASAWFAIGPNVKGGLHLGARWPGLDSNQLVDGRALVHTVDFREVYGSVLGKFLGFGNVSSVLPGYGGSTIDIV